MIRAITRPSTAVCTLPMYIAFLLSDSKPTSCLRLGNLLNISHDSVNRFLNRENYSANDMFNEAKSALDLVGGIVSVDDSVLDKPYSRHVEYVSHFYSGKHHRVVKGINLITLYYTDIHGNHQPINFRLYDKSENKTKNDYFLDMLAEVITWGARPSWVTMDSWYSCVKNLKTIKNHQMGFLVALESNRHVSIEKSIWVKVKDIDIPDEGTVVWLRDFGYVKVFRTNLKDQVRHYAIYLPKGEEDNNNYPDLLIGFSKNRFSHLHDQHWQIEQYHRTIKQVCHIEHFQVRNKVAVRNHIFSAILGYVKLRQMKAAEMIMNCYELQRDLFKEVIVGFIKSFAPSMSHMNSHYKAAVNA